MNNVEKVRNIIQLGCCNNSAARVVWLNSK